MSSQGNGDIADLKALESDADLEKLENALRQFNLFEAIGATRMEVRHSDFLAFLLDPSESHGLKDWFLKEFLKKIIARPGRCKEGVEPIALEQMDLTRTTVRREWEHTDIFCVNEANRLMVLIENKIDSGEGDGQLNRYLKEVERDYPASKGYRKILLYLTPDGDEPEDEESPYLVFSYSLVHDILEVIPKHPPVCDDVLMTISHYVEMLRRHIVSDSPIVKLAKEIYSRHRKVLDLILEQRRGQQLDWRAKLENLVRAELGLQLDDCSKGRIRFVPTEWDGIPELKKGEDWTSSGRILLFVFKNNLPDRLELGLYIGPSLAEAQEVREMILAAAETNRAVFRCSARKLSPRTKIWSVAFVNRGEFEELDEEQLGEKLEEKWKGFLTHNLPGLISGINKVFER